MHDINNTGKAQERLRSLSFYRIFAFPLPISVIAPSILKSQYPLFPRRLPLKNYCPSSLTSAICAGHRLCVRLFRFLSLKTAFHESDPSLHRIRRNRRRGDDIIAAHGSRGTKRSNGKNSRLIGYLLIFRPSMDAIMTSEANRPKTDRNFYYIISVLLCQQQCDRLRISLCRIFPANL